MELGIRKNKRGVFFTLVVVSLLSLFILSLTAFRVSNERETVNKRIKTMNEYVFSLEEDVPRKLFISGFRIIFLFEKRILENGTYISDVNTVFNEAFFDGTIEGTISSEELTLIQGIRFADIEDSLNEKASKVGLQVDLANPQLVVDQTDPWNVRIVLNATLLITDFGNLASWNRSASIEGFVPIEHFEDPIYLINTNGQIAHKINMTPYTYFTVGADVSNLQDHVNNFYYIANPDGPSFIKRLEGDLSSDPQGIESLVNLANLSSQGISIKDKTVVDHIYFSASDPAANNVAGMPSWFKLDAPHHDIYNVSGLIV